MEKYVLDTNIIFDDPYYINKIQNAEIYIPSVVLEEVDKHKNDKDVSMSVRIFSRYIDKLHERNYITDGNSKVIFTYKSFSKEELKYLGAETNDNIIIHTANTLGAKLISNDILVRSKSRMIGLEVAGLTSESTDNNLDEFYKGYIEVFLEDDIIDTFYQKKFISLDNIREIKSYPHMFIIFRRITNHSRFLIGKVDKNCRTVELINIIEDVWGISPKNPEQLMALHLLLDKDIPLVSLIGAAGTGKTLLSMAVGLLLTQDTGDYNKLVATKPIIDMGKELGTLPGDKEEKLMPYVESYYDALEFIFDGDRDKMHNALNGMQNNFEIDALNYIRGRSLPGRFFIVDEAQNLSRHEIKTIITRMGEGSKIILLGDPEQIDNKFLDKYNNGLVYAMDKFKDQQFGGHITFKKGVRSGLASLAADIL